jgi:nicotinate-nucleotide adenylyltransferase
MRIGIFGGTFNPIHLGHLRAAGEVRKKFKLDIIYFIPCNKPPHKTSDELLPPEVRLKLLKDAIKAYPYFQCSDIEIKRGGKSYSIDTIKDFINQGIKGEQLYFILGNDAFAEIKTWKNYRKLIELCNIIIMKRPGARGLSIKKNLPLDLFKTLRYNKKDKCYETKTGTRIFSTGIRGLKISSTMVRKLIRENKSVRYLVPDNVIEYIKKKNIAG